MKKGMCKILTCALALALAFGLTGGVLAESYPSKDFRLPTVQHRPAEPTEEPASEPVAEPTQEPTSGPTAEPTAEPASEPVAEPTAEPANEPAAAPVEKPAAEPTAEPTATEEPKYDFERDENGDLILDESGNPVAIVPEGMEIPVTYVRDENGGLILDEAGNPIPKDTVPADATVIQTLADQLNPERSIDVYVSWKDGKQEMGNEATLIAVLYGYENAVYALQWQSSPDGETWSDVPDAIDSRYTVVVSEENYLNYWQIQVTITDVVETASDIA